MKKFCTVFLLSMALLTGCRRGRSATVPLCRVVTKVDVEWVQEDKPRSYSLTETDQIQPVLIYLRTLRSIGQPDEDPERLDTDAWKIVVHRSDGSMRVYRQRGEEYLSRDSSPWELIDPAGGTRLEALVRGFEGEEL